MSHPFLSFYDDFLAKHCSRDRKVAYLKENGSDPFNQRWKQCSIADLPRLVRMARVTHITLPPNMLLIEPENKDDREMQKGHCQLLQDWLKEQQYAHAVVYSGGDSEHFWIPLQRDSNKHERKALVESICNGLGIPLEFVDKAYLKERQLWPLPFVHRETKGAYTQLQGMSEGKPLQVPDVQPEFKEVKRDNEAEEIKQKLSLFDIDNDLKPGLQSCPLPGHKHGDKNPSLSVSEDGRLFCCHSIHGGGDLFSWLKVRDNLDFKDALKMLQERLETSDMETTFKELEFTVNKDIKAKILPLEKSFRIVFETPKGKKAIDVRKENFFTSSNKLKEMAMLLEPDSDSKRLRKLVSELSTAFTSLSETTEWQHLLDAKKKMRDKREKREPHSSFVEISYGMVGDQWVETIRKDGKAVLMVCEPENFLAYKVVNLLKHEDLIYVPVTVPPDLLYMLPPEPITYADEKEIDEAILALVPYAVDLSKAESMYDEVWHSLLIPYIKHTWNFDDFNTTMFLRFLAEYGSGKTACLSFIGALCYRPILVGGQTLAVVLRFCDKYGPTLIWNELELAKSTDPEIIKLINNKFQKDYTFYRADQVDQKKVISYKVYGPIVAASRKPYADPSTESRFVTLPVDETLKDKIDLFFTIRERPEYDKLLGMLFYRRLLNKQAGVCPDQATVKKLPISKRSQQKYALLFPFITDERKEQVKRMLLMQEENESIRRSESEEGIFFNTILSLLASEDFEKYNPARGVATEAIKGVTKYQQVKRVMKSLGFYTVKKKETMEDAFGNKKISSRWKWFMKDKSQWCANVRRYVPFHYDSEMKKMYDSDFEFDEKIIPKQLLEHPEVEN